MQHVLLPAPAPPQFHIKKGPHAQRLPPGSSIGLVLPDVVAVVKRLREASQQMTMARWSAAGLVRGHMPGLQGAVRYAYDAPWQ